MAPAAWLSVVKSRWRSLVHRGELERELDDEIRDHLESEIEELVARDMDREDARRLARRRFGGVEGMKDECRDARGIGVVEAFAYDARYGARTLRRSPGFTLAAIVTLALGTGANTAVFSLVDRILVAPLPYRAPDRLVSVTGTYPNGAFEAMRAEVRTLDVAAYAEGHSLALTGHGEPARLAAARVSAEFFTVLGASPALGRSFRSGEDRFERDGFVVLSHALWEARFNGDPGIVGRSIRLDGVPREVIGVMPAAFQFPSSRTQVWVPLGADPRNTVRYWAGDFMPVIGRLHPDATLAQAHAEVRVFQSRIGSRFPWPMPADWNRDVTVVTLQEALAGPVRLKLLILIAAVVLVLVVACANVANLCLSRAMTREREIGIRTAVGAGPGRIARQMLTECVLLAGLGAAAGLLVAVQALALLKLLLPADTPRLNEVDLDWRALAFAAAIAVLTGCAFGLAPVGHALRLRLRAALEHGGRGAGGAVAGPARAILSVAQIACAVLLVIAAGLLLRSLWRLSHVDLGFRTERVLTARILPTESLCASPERCLAFYRTLAAEAEPHAAPDRVALINTLPLTGAVAKRSLEIEDFTVPAAESDSLFWLNVITPDYFSVMGIRIEAGRAFTFADLSGNPPVAIVSAASARRFWPGRPAVGRHVRFAGETQWRTVVGVADDIRGFDLTRDIPDFMDGAMYVPQAYNATLEDGRIPTEMTLVVRTSSSPAQLHATLRDLPAVTGEVVISDVRPMHAVVADALAAPAAIAALLAGMATLALMLGSIGVYGVLAYLVSKRTRELAIRFALGAGRRDVFRLVLREGARLCAAGIAIGLAAALAVTRLLSSELHGVSPLDPLTYLSVAFAVAAVTLLACYVPTRRATRVDPTVVLREG